MSVQRARFFSLVVAVFLSGALPIRAEKRALTVEDIMEFRQIRDTVISADGSWVAFQAYPDRGDPEVRVHDTQGQVSHAIPRGSDPRLSRDGRWVAAALQPPFEDDAAGDERESRRGLALLNTEDGRVETMENVRRFLFSRDSHWLAYQRHPDEGDATENAENAPDADKEAVVGTPLIVRDLRDGSESTIESVTSFEFSRSGEYLAYAAATKDGGGNGVFCRHLAVAPGAEVVASRSEGTRYDGLTWSRDNDRLAFVATRDDDEFASAALHLWEGPDSSQVLVDAASLPAGWQLPAGSRLRWSRDGKRLFFGLQPSPAESDEIDEDGESERETLLRKRGVDVWHWLDPRIQSQQRRLWTRTREQQFDAVFHVAQRRVVVLADPEMPEIRRAENPAAALGLSDVPYRREATWNGNFRDAYRVDLESGRRHLVARRVAGRVEFSPGGRYAAWFADGHWRLYDSERESTVNLTEGIETPFFNEDHDYPSDLPSYGAAGWLAGDQALLLYDKFDIWRFPLPSGEPVCLSWREGRRAQRTFRALQTDSDADAWPADEPILLLGYHHKAKNFGFFSTHPAAGGVKQLREAAKKFDFVARAEDADVIVFTRQDYGEFPDLRVSDPSFEKVVRLTRLNPQIEEFAFGTSELVEWSSLDGTPLQGVLIKPGHYKEGERYPVIVYFYRFFSQRLHEFNQMVINHRPNFAYYASNGYAIFLPDIRFEVGRPGFSATKCLVPGVQKLIDMGIADPEAIGLHGHSWSGYQTAFVITQTNLFAAAVAGAPVSNMTSAYSGIRWQSGLARQFQYEKTQSRIGGSLWDVPERYIENSPVFFADRIETPLLIQFGDEDGAVPWYQGIELYLAMRRLGKSAVMLQYRGEPHHLQKYANKLDYTLKMREFFDHFLKGAPAPVWWSDGVPYRGQ